MIRKMRSYIALRDHPPVSPSVGRTVLIVEDCIIARYAVCDALQYAGYTVLEAATGQEAVRILKSKPVDVVFVDVHLPSEAEGLLVASYARLHQPEARVIATSGQRREGDQRTAEMLGSFLPKPYLIRRLVEMIQTDEVAPAVEEAPEPLGSVFRLEPLWNPDPSCLCARAGSVAVSACPAVGQVDDSGAGRERHERANTQRGSLPNGG